ncbi:FAD-dependent oxidoreductase [Corynebacterium stationis]|uniref:FAD-dependent oxidoreductase n=1 Tax=Corynebacterium stationis TaxID=1705 RepID=UPI0032206AA8
MNFHATVAVIGAGQAGLSAAYHLARRDFVSALGNPSASQGGEESSPGTFIVFDAEESAGGAWRHRQESLTMATVNGIFDLPGMEQSEIKKTTPALEAVPNYFSDYEAKMDLPIIRPVSVASVNEAGSGYLIELAAQSTSAGTNSPYAGSTWQVDAVINATGTWNNPNQPQYPGIEKFQGRQLHSKDYVRMEDFTSQRVAVVGGGISAVQQLAEVSDVAKQTYWYTRSKPFFRASFTAEEGGRQTIDKVTKHTEAGNAPRSIVSYTGLIFNQDAKRAHANGALNRRPIFQGLYENGIIEEDGTQVEVDTIIWAIGFRPSLAHLDPLNLYNEKGGINIEGTKVEGKKNLHLIGYGPSQSTVGANRAGRDAVISIARDLKSGT